MQDTLYVEPRRARAGAAAHAHVAGADPGDGDAEAADLRRSCRAAPTATRRSTPATRRCSTRSRALAVDRGITFGDLAGTLEAFTQRVLRQEAEVAPGSARFFPFTEPSAEFAISCVFCDGAGCRVCSKTGWIELGGCGMVDPNVFQRRRHRPRGVHRLRVRLRARAHADAPLRRRADQDVLRQRHPLPRAVLRHPCARRSPGSASSRPLDADPVDDRRTALDHLGLEVEGVEAARRARSPA